MRVVEVIYIPGPDGDPVPDRVEHVDPRHVKRVDDRVWLDTKVDITGMLDGDRPKFLLADSAEELDEKIQRLIAGRPV